MSDGHEIRVETGRKRVRGLVGGEVVFDTTRPLLVWEHPYFPSYYIPAPDVAGSLVENGRTKESRRIGHARLHDLKAGGVLREDAAAVYPDSPVVELREAVRFEWDAIDEWLEEDEPIYTHPRDPYSRVDILSSSRHVEVVVDGTKIADSRKPTILFETGLPPRFYLPLTDVRMDLFEPSETETHCPYKGTANYWSLSANGKRYDDFAWMYRTPLPESQKVAGLVCFYNEKVDLYVDGELQERPKTKFS
jgi:uncharacterized protein (DUF427 family)